MVAIQCQVMPLTRLRLILDDYECAVWKCDHRVVDAVSLVQYVCLVFSSLFLCGPLCTEKMHRSIDRHSRAERKCASRMIIHTPFVALLS